MSNKRLISPVSNDCIFGHVEGRTIKGIIIPSGPIYLKEGKHFGPNRGFGVEHIWAEHRVEMAALGYETKNDVANYVADIVRPGSSIYCEFDNIRAGLKLTVIRTVIGTAILQHQEKGDSHYSVLTAFSRKTANGTLIGSIRAKI